MARVTITVDEVQDGKLTVEGKDNYGKLCQVYADRVMAMSDQELEKETEEKIWLSAFAANNPRSDYHWHVDVCYSVCKHRDPAIYDWAHRTASSR